LFKIRDMPEVQPPPPLPKSQPWFGRRRSTILKLVGVGALVLVLLIPLAMITGVLNERLQRRSEAVADITSSWGKEQNVIGPVLGVPYQYKFKTVKEIPGPDEKVERREVEETATPNAYFLPETLNVSGTVEDTEVASRNLRSSGLSCADGSLRQVCSARFCTAQDRSERCAMEGRVCHNRNQRSARHA